MGDMNHNAVIATTSNDKEVARIRRWVDTIGPDSKTLFLFGPSAINNESTVVMVPDGSKEGWADSNAGNDLRAEFIFELEKANYSDGSNPWSYIEVGYGDYGQTILTGNCKRRV
jgi:hypothetical protein